MPAKYKDYPIYTYDEPVTYNDFSGGINTDPSNEHLLANEMRDCLNMHYKSAALVKRKGASLLCTISCEDELFNIQGVFLFTYKTTYIILAADGKLYQGIYSPKSTITLARLSIIFPVVTGTDLYNSSDVTIGLPQYIEDLTIREKHDGFIHRFLLDEYGEKHSLAENENFKDYFELEDGIELKSGDVISYNGDLYTLYTKSSSTRLVKTSVKPTGIPSSELYWLPISIYNEQYKEDINSNSDPISQAIASNNSLTSITKNGNNEWVLFNNNDFKFTWTSTTYKYYIGQVVEFEYNGVKDLYVCIRDHFSCVNSPGEQKLTIPDSTWLKTKDQKELVFQNSLEIEAATYDNKLYITTGTRFVQVELIEDKLIAYVVTPYKCNNNEIINIGYNYLSPYPTHCVATTYNQAITSISNLLVQKQTSGKYLLKPLMTFAGNETEKDYYYKWEKLIGDTWVTIKSYKDNVITTDGKKLDWSTLLVDDADKYQYRVSFAKSFDKPSEIVDHWVYESTYKVGDFVSVTDDNEKERIYKCLIAHSPNKLIWDGINYEKVYNQNPNAHKTYYLSEYKKDDNGVYSPEVTPIFCTHTTSKQGQAFYEKQEDGTYVFKGYYNTTVNNKEQQGMVYWQEVFIEDEIILFNEEKNEYITSNDWAVNKIDGEYFGQATSIITDSLTVVDNFTLIHSCRKITADGNKFLLYGDKYNSGSWFKTIINNPSYITDRGGLSFKTTKNEELLKVIPFNGVLLAFANSENIGGSIHLITGNGDDYDDQSGYYSPYKRVTINNSISCDNEKTIQICENLIVFKYFDTVYYIESSELSQEVVTIHSCNDRLKHLESKVIIPWEDNSCISEVTEDYYALIWKEKFYIENGELIQERPGLKLKMYYKQGFQTDHKIFFPWLRDESDYFNVDHILYIKGKPIYLYNNTLITFNENIYTDFGKNYKCMIHFRGEDIGYPKMYKLISNVLVYYHRTQSSKIDFDLLARNEAGHILLDSSIKRASLQDLRSLRTGDILENNSIRLDSTILDSRVFNTNYKFPCLLVDTIISSCNEKDFSLSSITYNYTTSETPDTTAYDLYSNIIRLKEVK